MPQRHWVRESARPTGPIDQLHTCRLAAIGGLTPGEIPADGWHIVGLVRELLRRSSLSKPADALPVKRQALATRVIVACLLFFICTPKSFALDCNSQAVLDAEKDELAGALINDSPQIRQMRAMRSQYPPYQQSELDAQIEKFVVAGKQELKMQTVDVAGFTNPDKTIECQVKVSLIPLPARGDESQRKVWPVPFRFVIRIADDGQHFFVRLPKQ